jgi:hypothetical protein
MLIECNVIAGDERLLPDPSVICNLIGIVAPLFTGLDASYN